MSQRYLIATLFFVIALDALGTGFVWPLFGPLFTGKDSTFFANTVSMEWRNILYGITIGAANLSSFLCAPLLGNISDYIGRRKVLVFCLIGTSFGMGICIVGIIFKQLWLLILSRAWLGAVAANQVIAQAAVIDISSPENKNQRLGIISAANNTGYILGPVLAGILVDGSIIPWFNATTPFYFAAVLSFFGAWFLLKTFREQKKTCGINNTARETTTKFTKKIFIFVRIFANKHLCSIAIIYFFLQVGWALYLQTSFLFLVQKCNYSPRMLSYFLVWLELIFCFHLLVGTRFFVRFFSLMKMIYLTLIVASICCFMSALFNTEFGAWCNVLFMASVIALGSNAVITKLSNIAEEHEQGWVMGVGSSLSALAWAITPPAAGVLLIYGFKLPLFIAGALFVLMWIVLLGVKNIKPRD